MKIECCLKAGVNSSGLVQHAGAIAVNCALVTEDKSAVGTQPRDISVKYEGCEMGLIASLGAFLVPNPRAII